MKGGKEESGTDGVASETTKNTHDIVTVDSNINIEKGLSTEVINSGFADEAHESSKYSVVTVDNGSDVEEDVSNAIYNVEEMYELYELPNTVKYIKLMQDWVDGSVISILESLIYTNKEIKNIDIFVGNMDSDDIDDLGYLCGAYGVEIDYFSYLDTES